MTKMLVDKLVLEQALEALEFPAVSFPVDRHKAAAALRAALAEPVQESVKLPTTGTEAELMVKLGRIWLEQNLR